MSFSAADSSGARARLLDALSVRIDEATALTSAMREGLARADAASIEEATVRLGTVTLEFRVLADEHARLGPPGDRDVDDPGYRRSAARFEDSVLALARAAAVAGGMLERMVTIGRRLLSALGAPQGGSYLPTGRAASLDAGGLGLQERA